VAYIRNLYTVESEEHTEYIKITGQCAKMANVGDSLSEIQLIQG